LGSTSGNLGNSERRELVLKIFELLLQIGLGRGTEFRGLDFGLKTEEREAVLRFWNIIYIIGDGGSEWIGIWVAVDAKVKDIDIIASDVVDWISN
jgi:hypothetical protein